jgi:hypothetical protein
LFNNGDEIATFIALGDWTESNGIFAVRNWSEGKGDSPENRRESDDNRLFYIELRSGEDVSISGAETLFFSGKAGGLALMLRSQFSKS